jgi:protein AFG1
MIEGFDGLDKTGPGSEQSVLNKLAESTWSKSPSELEQSSREEANILKSTTPRKYLLTSSDNERTWETVVSSALPSDIQSPIPWQSTTLPVYGRTVSVQHQLDGITCWSFNGLRRIIRTGRLHHPSFDIPYAHPGDVPVLTSFQKNEARRLITLLDALYEARCKLIIRAEAGPDDLFFPETKATSPMAEGAETKRGESDGRRCCLP